MSWETIIALVVGSAGGGGVLGALGRYFLERRKIAGQQRVDESKAEHEQKVAQAKLEHDHESQLIGRLEKRIDTLEAQHADCTTHNIRLSMEVGRLQEAVGRLESELRKYRRKAPDGRGDNTEESEK